MYALKAMPTLCLFSLKLKQQHAQSKSGALSHQCVLMIFLHLP